MFFPSYIPGFLLTFSISKALNGFIYFLFLNTACVVYISSEAKDEKKHLLGNLGENKNIPFYTTSIPFLSAPLHVFLFAPSVFSFNSGRLY